MRVQTAATARVAGPTGSGASGPTGLGVVAGEGSGPPGPSGRGAGSGGRSGDLGASAGSVIGCSGNGAFGTSMSAGKFVPQPGWDKPSGRTVADAQKGSATALASAAATASDRRPPTPPGTARTRGPPPLLTTLARIRTGTGESPNGTMSPAMRPMMSANGPSPKRDTAYWLRALGTAVASRTTW